MLLFDEVGGQPVVDAVVDRFYDRMLDDGAVADWFGAVDMRTLKAHQRAFLVVGLGGPEEYEGRSMRTAHAGLGITNAAFTAALGHLSAALRDVGVAEHLVNQVVLRIESMRVAIVNTP